MSTIAPVVIALAAATKTAAAEPAPIAVRISEDLHEGCPSEPSILSRLQAQLESIHEAREGEAAVDLSVHVVRRDGASFGTLVLVVGGATEERAAWSSSCAEVVSALSVMAAIAIGEETVQVTPVPAHAAAAPARPHAADALQAPAPVSSLRAGHVDVGVGTGLEVNGSNGGMFAANWFASFTLPARFLPTLRIALARSLRERTSSPSGTIAVQWNEARLAVCGDAVLATRLRIGPCVNFELGKLDTIVVAPLPARSSSYLWLTSGAGAKLAWTPVTPLSFELSMGVRVPLQHGNLYFEPGTVVYAVPSIVPFAGAGVLAHLP